MSDVLSDPDFLDFSLICTRNAQTVGSDGLAVIASKQMPFAGVVAATSGQDLRRRSDGEMNVGEISIITKFLLIDGRPGNTADVVTWNGNTYTVTNVEDYSKYGRGFVAATCDLVQLAG
jgi:hypothetical protein